MVPPSEWMANIFVLFEIRCLKLEYFENIFHPDIWHYIDLSLWKTFGCQIVIKCAIVRKQFLFMAFPKLELFRKYCYLHYTDLWINSYFIILFSLVLEIQISAKLPRGNKNKSVLLCYNSIAITFIHIIMSSPLSLLVLHFNWRGNDPRNVFYC